MKIARCICASVVMAVAATWTASSVSVVEAQSIAPTSARQALGRTVRELNVDGQSLSRVVEFLRDVSGANIVVNWSVLESVGVAKETPISMQVRELSLRKMMQLVLDQASPNTQLVVEVDSNVIQVTTQEEADRKMITKVYIVDDLVMVGNQNQAPRLNLNNQMGGGGYGGGYGGGFGGGGLGGGLGFGGGNYGGGNYGGGNYGGGNYGGGNYGGGNYGGGNYGGGGLFQSDYNSNRQTQQQSTTDKGNELVELIREVIRPSIWVENGGTASIRYFSGKLIVTAPVSVQEAIGGPVNAGMGSVRFGY